MPAKPTWLMRVPQILDALRSLPAPFVDRDTIETLFRLRRRRSIDLMRHFGGYQIGRTFLVDKAQLMAALEQIAGGDDFAWEARRKARLAEAVERAQREQRARTVKIQAPRQLADPGIPDLPGSIQLARGELRIEFRGAEDLLRHLLELSQAIMNDYPRFQALVE